MEWIRTVNLLFLTGRVLERGGARGEGCGSIRSTEWGRRLGRWQCLPPCAGKRMAKGPRGLALGGWWTRWIRTELRPRVETLLTFVCLLSLPLVSVDRLLLNCLGMAAEPVTYFFLMLAPASSADTSELHNHSIMQFLITLGESRTSSTVSAGAQLRKVLAGRLMKH